MPEGGVLSLFINTTFLVSQAAVKVQQAAVDIQQQAVV